MTRRAPLARRVARAAVVLIATAALSPPAHAQAAGPLASSAPLSVPFLPQSEDLCGGAAAAMVMRYWGARGIYPEAFAPLVDHSAGGIRTGALVSALDARGWTAVAESGTPERVEQQLARRQPVVALIQVSRTRYHYVVIVARTAGRTILHDPARGPDRTMTDAAFDRAWAATDRWMMTVLPPANLTAAVPVKEPFAPEPPAACASLMSQGVARAQTDPSTSRQLLQQASSACPRSSAPWRELAGLDAVAKDWRSAADHASRAVALDARDQYAWQLLGTARFLSGADVAALDAWNHVEKPTIDLVNVSGLDRTRYRIVYDAAGFAPGALLAPAALRLADRRVKDIPSVATARVSYHPTDSERAQVDVAVVERDAYPRGLVALAALGAGAAANQTAAASLASLSGGGERVDVSWRWWAHRPAASVAFLAPAPLIHGVWQVDASRETETFASSARQTHTHAGGAAGAWLTDRLRVEGLAGIDRWLDRGRQGMIGADAEFWPIADRLRFHARISHWSGDDSFSVGVIDASFTSSTARSGNTWLLRGGAAQASDAAPALAWPGADTGHVRDVLLRAHPLLDDDLIARGVYGKRLLSGGAEWQRWTRPSKWLIQYAPAVFVDAAKASRGFASTIDTAQIDLGAGIRISAAGAGILRMDVAHGLRDGRTAFSVVLERE